MKTTNAVVAASLLVALAGVACSGEVIEYYPPDATGGAVSAGGGSSASGGAAVTGGGGPGSSSGGASEETIVLTGVGGQEGMNYNPSGYPKDSPDFPGVVVDGMQSYREADLYGCLMGGGISRSVFDLASCTAGTMCQDSCADDRTCVLYQGTATPRCVSCAPDDPGCTSTEPSCVLECTEDSQCPYMMACMQDSGGRKICMHPDVPYTPECMDSCTPALQECNEDKPCCRGTTCKDGYCMPYRQVSDP